MAKSVVDSDDEGKSLPLISTEKTSAAEKKGGRRSCNERTPSSEFYGSSTSKQKKKSRAKSKHHVNAVKEYRKRTNSTKATKATRRGTGRQPSQLCELVGYKQEDLKNFVPPVFEKNGLTSTLIKTALKRNVFIPKMSSKEYEPLIDAFEELVVPDGHVIIEQGGKGDYFYIVGKGQVEFLVNGCVVGAATSGKSFGELALLYSCPRAAKVVAKSEKGTTMTRLFRVDHKTFRLTLQKQIIEGEKRKLELLQQVDFLQNIGIANLVRLGRAMTPRIFDKGDVLIEKGSPAKTFFMLQEGRVKIKYGSSSDAGDKKESEKRTPGEYFGESALTTGEAHDATIKASTGGIAFVIERTIFEKVVGNYNLLLDKKDNRKILEKVMKDVFPFADLTPEQIQELTDLITDETFDTNTKILKKGKSVEAALYIVYEGQVQLAGKRNEIVRAGGIFGEDIISMDTHLSQSPDATTPTETIATYTATALASTIVCGVLTLSDCRAVFDTSQSDGFRLSTSLRLQDVNQVDKSSCSIEDDDIELLAAAMPTSLGRETTMQWLAKSSSQTLRDSVRKQIALEDLNRMLVLGEGQFGEVWLVSFDMGVDTHEYALKVQHKNDPTRGDSIAAVKQEIEVLKFMDHPFIVNLIHHYEDGDFLYILMGLVHGGELFDTIHYQGDDGLWYSGIDEDHAKFYALVVADTLNYIHRKHYIFRDLKPENILIDKDGYPIICDFGFAKFVEDKTYTLCGTPNYLAPEVIRNAGHDFAVDYWALGVVIYEMLQGENPFYDEGMDQITLFSSIATLPFYPLSKECSSDASDIIAALLEKDPRQRLGSLAGGTKAVVRHKWFDSIDLCKLRQKRVVPPYAPGVATKFMETVDE